MSYGVILVRSDIDRFAHHTLFANELLPAFAARNVEVRILDYISESKKVFGSLQDPDCKFFLTFNGFGTELRMPTLKIGSLDSAFDVFGKPVFDLMHDCPAHETMAHQLNSTFPQRRLLATDYTYASMAQQMGIRDVTLVPSITFPAALEGADTPPERDIELLLAIGTSPPQIFANRISTATSKGRLFKSVFDEVTALCANAWNVDPSQALIAALQSLGIPFQVAVPEHRFLLTVVLDYVKFVRRQELVRALSDLPVTLVPDRDGDYPKGFKVEKPRNAIELIAMMRRSRVVVCPTTHFTGHHERPLSAFTASSAVVSAPNRVLSAAFTDGRDIAFGNDAASIGKLVRQLLDDPDAARRMGERGHERAMQLYHPDRLVSTVLNRMQPLP